MIDILTLAVFAIVWGTPAYFLGQYAGRRGHSPVVFFLISVITSPLVSYLFAKYLPEGERLPGPASPAPPLAAAPAYAAPPPSSYEPPAYARDPSQSRSGCNPPPSS